jgi:hypothetical protein
VRNNHAGRAWDKDGSSYRSLTPLDDHRSLSQQLQAGDRRSFAGREEIIFSLADWWPSDPATGLSALQGVMLDDPHPVRLLSAPTGAGKSWAFQKAMRERGACVLFVVPTRRLAQNLRKGLVADLVRNGMPEAGALARESLWTSDERAAQEAEGVNVRDRRLQEVRAEHGRMILATPESVAWHLLNPRRRSEAVSPEMI